MRELRSAANAFFWFALFLLGWALVVPPPEDPLQCPPADSDVTAQLYRTDSILN